MNPAQYVGTPYSKLDCFALVRLCARECFGLEFPQLPEFTDYAPRIITEQLQSGDWLSVPYSDKRAGDVVTLSPIRTSCAHVGIAIDNIHILHNDKKFGAIIQDDGGLRRRGFLFRNVYRWNKK